MGCFSGRLMTSASDQKLFCEVCSVFSYYSDEFVGEKVVSPSYSSTILAPLLLGHVLYTLLFLQFSYEAISIRDTRVATDCRGNIISGGIPNLMFLKPFYSAVHHPSILLCIYILSILGASLVAQRLKRLPGMQEAQVRSLSWDDPLEKEMATHSSTLAWRIPRREDPGKLLSMGSQRVRHD